MIFKLKKNTSTIVFLAEDNGSNYFFVAGIKKKNRYPSHFLNLHEYEHALYVNIAYIPIICFLIGAAGGLAASLFLNACASR